MDYLLGALLLLTALGVLIAKRPVYAALSFLGTLLLLAVHYLLLSAEFIAVMQILVYAGAILVLFIFVMMLFQDSFHQLKQTLAKSSKVFIAFSVSAFLVGVGFVLVKAIPLTTTSNNTLPEGFGQAKALGRALYLDFFFPFEAVILLFLVGVVGAVFIGKKDPEK